MAVIGIRREDKSKYERRAPIDPANMAAAIHRHKLGFVVEPSDIRVFSDQEYREAGGAVGSGLEHLGHTPDPDPAHQFVFSEDFGH